jgi:HTH-type transcriptional regulator, sugar sensing transcriptional regulator
VAARKINNLLAEISDDLRALGFTDYEMRAYLALLRDSPATAYQVSKESGLPRANVYPALEALTKKGAAQPVTESPARYVPVPPEVLFARLVQDVDAQCRRVASKLSRLRQSNGEEFVWSLRGDGAIRDKIESMIASVRSHIWIKAHLRMLEPHRDALLHAASRGVQVILILFGDPASLAEFKLDPPSRVYMHEGNGFEVGLANTLITVTRDFEEALTVNAAEGGFGAYTRNLPVVNMAESLIRHEIYLAEIFGQFGREIEATFGPALVSLRRNYLPAAQAEALDDLLKPRRRVRSAKSATKRKRSPTSRQAQGPSRVERIGPPPYEEEFDAHKTA